MVQTLVANITNAEGGVINWYIIQAVGDCDYNVGDVLLPNNGITIVPALPSPYVSTVDVTYTPGACQNLVVAITVTIGDTVCFENLYDLSGPINNNWHYECQVNNDIPGCLVVPGLINNSNPEHFASLQACQECTSCACSITEQPCDNINFTMVYNCTENPHDNNELEIYLTQNDTGQDVTITLIEATIGTNYYNIATDVELTFSTVGGLPVVIEPEDLLPNGEYYLTVFVTTDVCALDPFTILVSCGTTPPPPEIGQGCCSSFAPASAGSNTAGQLTCQVIDLSYLLGDTSQDIIIDFSCNIVADKVEVYKGVVDCGQMQNTGHAFESELIASTPYIGATTGDGSCINLGACFIPAQQSDTTPVVSGFWVGEGIYDEISNPCDTGIMGLSCTPLNVTTGLTPDFALPDYCSTTDSPICGGIYVSGRGRLIISAGSYTEDKITIVVHGSASEGFYDDNCDACFFTNATAWQYYIHCPGCELLECDLTIINPNYTCTDSIGGISLELETNAYNPLEPVEVSITPLGGQVISFLVNNYALVTDGLGDDHYYQIIDFDNDNDNVNESVGILITDDLDLNLYTIYFAYSSPSSLDNLTLPNGGYLITVGDMLRCSDTAGVYVDCDCEASLFGMYDSTYCQGDTVNIVVGGTGFPCNLYGNHTLTGDALPVGLTVTSN
ncbi:MAG TPA: hypothetical protein PKD00_01760, partial [Burkholderiales bacterium]|nr:hypothetical protein [Burkholderiales bacterium]